MFKPRSLTLHCYRAITTLLNGCKDSTSLVLPDLLKYLEKLPLNLNPQPCFMKRSFGKYSRMDLFYKNADGLIRILVGAITAYPLLVLFLRLSGKRTLSKMNAFDFVVTVALGSTLATLIMSKSTPILEGILALFLLVALQYLVAWLSVHVRFFQRMIKSTPSTLYEDGHFYDETLISQRISKDDIHQKVRSSGMSSLAQVKKIVLESDGDISVIKK